LRSAIEASGSHFRLLTGLVFVGGLARLYAAVLTGPPGPAMRANALSAGSGKDG